MSRWDKIKNGEIYSFKGGIYPPENKNTTDCPIEQLPSPSRLVLPLKQHSGTAADVLVEVGQHVRMNEPLTAPKSTMQVPIHSPVAGTVEAVTMHNVPHPSGYAEPCIVIKCDDGFDYAGIQEDQIHHYDPIPDYREKTVDELLERIKSMGIAGLGGAGFPTDVKLRSSASANNCQLLIINGAECEPYITCDDRLMQERADFKYVTDNKPDLHESFAKECADRYFTTPKKMGAQTQEANINAGIAAVKQIVDFCVNGNTRFQVNK